MAETVGELRCPCHGSVFSLSTGTPLHGPATVDEIVFDTRLTDGKIEVRPRQR